MFSAQSRFIGLDIVSVNNAGRGCGNMGKIIYFKVVQAYSTRSCIFSS